MDLITMENSFQFQLLSGLTNDASLSVSDVLARFIKYESEETTFYTDEDHPWAWETFYCLLQVAKRTSSVEKLDKLVAFVMELQKVKAYNPTTGKQARNSEWYIWSDLPQFAWAGSDELEFVGKDLTGNLLPSKALQQQENFITFLARFSNAIDVPYSHPTRPAADFTYAAEINHRCMIDLGCEAVLKRMHTRFFCLWLIHSGERILTNIQHEPCWPNPDDTVTFQLYPQDWETWGNNVEKARSLYDTDTTRLIDAALQSMDDAVAKHGKPFRRAEVAT